MQVNQLTLAGWRPCELLAKFSSLHSNRGFSLQKLKFKTFEDCVDSCDSESDSEDIHECNSLLYQMRGSICANDCLSNTT